MGFKTLIERGVNKLIKIAKKICKHSIDDFDFSFLNGMFGTAKHKRGKPIIYDRIELFKLTCEAFKEGKRSSSEIARYAKKQSIKLRYWVDKSPSHDTISDFFNELSDIIDDIFDIFVKKAKGFGMFKTYVPKLIDTTDIKTQFKSDPDAQWNKDTSKDCWYWGYGGLVVIDGETHLPCAARLTSSKKVDAYPCMEAVGKVIELVGADVVIGDSEFDMASLIHYAENYNILVIAPYNPRNSKQSLPIKYRNQMTHNFEYEWLNETYRERVEVEHSIGTMKENCGLDELYVKGYKKVQTAFFFALIVRLLFGIIAFQQNLNPRRVTLI